MYPHNSTLTHFRNRIVIAKLIVVSLCMLLMAFVISPAYSDTLPDTPTYAVNQLPMEIHSVGPYGMTGLIYNPNNPVHSPDSVLVAISVYNGVVTLERYNDITLKQIGKSRNRFKQLFNLATTTKFQWCVGIDDVPAARDSNGYVRCPE